ncbi:MAG: hypothetical protein JXC36_03710 [Candidatus Atribacteria bacterium]|nr:hypothetical protein [Candidatus Atribacteria bacterium]
MTRTFSNIEIVTISVYLLSGDSKLVDTEDIAVKTNELAPGRFVWLKYQDQINIEKVRTSLSDAKKSKNGSYIIGLHKDGWQLTQAGLDFSKKNIRDFRKVDISRPPINKKEAIYYNREKLRMLSTEAYKKVISNNSKAVTVQEAEAFFRLDEYIKGEIRNQKIERIVTSFNDDPDLKDVIQILAERVRKNVK